MPLQRRVPKLRGFNNPFRVEYQAINLDVLEESGLDEVDPGHAGRAGPGAQGRAGQGARPGRADPRRAGRRPTGSPAPPRPPSPSGAAAWRSCRCPSATAGPRPRATNTQQVAVRGVALGAAVGWRPAVCGSERPPALGTRGRGWVRRPDIGGARWSGPMPRVGSRSGGVGWQTVLVRRPLGHPPPSRRSRPLGALEVVATQASSAKSLPPGEHGQHVPGPRPASEDPLHAGHRAAVPAGIVHPRPGHRPQRRPAAQGERRTGRHPRPAPAVLRRGAHPVRHLRPRHHALHHLVDHPADPRAW